MAVGAGKHGAAKEGYDMFYYYITFIPKKANVKPRTLPDRCSDGFFLMKTL